MAFPWVPCALFGSGEAAAKLFVGLGFRQVALNACHLLVPHRLVDAVDIELRGGVPDKAFEDTVKVLADSSPMQAGQRSDDVGQCSSAARFVMALRSLSPVRLRRWALWTRRSRMASATVGLAIMSCQCFRSSWLVTMVGPRPWRSSRISRAPRTMTIFSSDRSLARRDGDFGS